MGTALVKAEIGRFLRSTPSEVLCVKGRWGVGKTYAWSEFLREAASEKQLALKKYSYVSLFGLNSLDALRYAIFENKISEAQVERGPNLDTLKDAIDGAVVIGRKAKPLLAPILNKLGIRDAEESLARATFFSVRNQIVCIDDLERAGSSLELKDVLGLASMLKEQRGCKVVLLLNDEQLPEGNKEQFEKLLEKVVDVSLVFDPSVEEALSIAFREETFVNRLLKERIVRVGITNIRVIKKIERLADRLGELLDGFHEKVMGSAMTAVTLAGWAVFIPDTAPSANFLKRYNRDVAALRAQQADDEQAKWTEILGAFGYKISDDLDVQIIEGVVRGYFDDTELLRAARELQDQIENDTWENPFTQAWERYHGSLTEDDDVVLDGLYEASLQNLGKITPINLSGTAKLLRECGRDEQASNLVATYMEARKFGRGVLDEQVRIWGEEDIDPQLEAALKEIDNAYVDERDPKEVLCKIAREQGWNQEDIALLARQSAEDFEHIFESIQGKELPSIARFAVRLGRMEGENYKAMGKSVEGGLKRIAAKSPLRAKRVASYGVVLE